MKMTIYTHANKTKATQMLRLYEHNLYERILWGFWACSK